MAPSIATMKTGERSALPRLVLADGTLEGLKWLALLLMTLDHVNKYLLHESVPVLFYLGRLAMPLFVFVLAYNLARPGSMERGAYSRAGRRMAIGGVISSVPFIGLGGLVMEWWPLNIMFMLLVATGVMYLVERGGALRLVLASLVFVIGGAFVEFWWPAIVIALAAWRYVKRPSWSALIVWTFATAALYVVNRNMWALLSLPLIFLAMQVDMRMPRLRHVFYAYYPLHLLVIWLVQRLYLRHP